MPVPKSTEVEPLPGWGDLFAGKNAVRSIALAGGVALHAINVYIATTILPSVVADIGGLDYYAWNTTLFVIASIIGSALAVKLLQVSGPRGAYVIAATIFGIGTLICSLAPNMAYLLAGRSVQGLGGGFMLALSYTMIRIVFPEKLWPRAIAVVSGMWGVATLVGPAVGGIFAELGAWRAAFWSVIPAVILFAIMAYLVLPAEKHRSTDQSRLPIWQLIILSIAVLAVSMGSLSAKLSWNIAGVLVSGLLIAILIQIDRVSSSRLLPRGSFNLSSPLGALFATMALLGITITSTEVFVPLFLQVLHHQTPLVAGYLTALMGAGWTVGSILSSSAEQKRARQAIIAAPLVSLTGLIMLAILVPPPSQGQLMLIIPVCLAFIALGFGVGVSWPHLLSRVLRVAPADEQDLASTAITTVQLFSAGLGAALAGMVTNMGGLTNPGGIAGTSSAALWLFCGFMIVPVMAIFTTRRVASGMK